MAIRDENDNKVTPLIPQTNDDEVIKTAIWKFDVEEAMSKVDHGRYEYNPNGKIVYDTKVLTAREIDFKKTLRCSGIPDKTDTMIFIKSPVEQPYNYVGKDTCENACFAVIISKAEPIKCSVLPDDNDQVYDMFLFGLRDGWLNARISEWDNEKIKSSNLSNKDVSIHGPAVLLEHKCVPAKNISDLTWHIDTLISKEYRLFMSDKYLHEIEAPACINAYMEMTGATEKQACQVLMQHLNAWPEGVRSYYELLDDVFTKVAVEQSKSINPAEDFLSHVKEHLIDDEHLNLLVAKEHWLDMKAANEKGLLYQPGPFSGMIQSGEYVDPDKMLEMIDAGIKNIMDCTGNPKTTIKPLRNQSERGEK